MSVIYALPLVFAACATLIENEAFRIGNSLKDIHVTINPDTHLTPPKIIRRHGYPAETHIIESEDGYLLEYHRIPHGKYGNVTKARTPILLHHGLLCSSIDWIVNGPEKSLAYRLADQGYDVWMANARGNTFSRSHVSVSPKDEAFWNFSFHEMGKYDVPAALDYILNTTSREKLLYIGHSLGTTIFYVFATSRPHYSNKILAQISIAPVAALPHTTSAFRRLVPIAKEIKSMTDWYSNGAFLEHDLLTSLMCKYICGKHVFNYDICVQLVIYNLFGKDAQQFNESLVPVVTSNIPAGTSGKNMIHCAQLIQRGEFAQYDYGEEKNLKIYNSKQPPIYNMSKISSPVKIYYGKNDILADPLDVQLLYQKIPNPMGLTSIDFDKWNHVDFLWGIEVNKYFNEQLLEFVANITQNGTDFIRSVVENAIAKRIKMEIPVNTPFNEQNFMIGGGEANHFVRTMRRLPSVIKTNMENGVNKIKHDVGNVNTAISETVQSIRTGVSKTAENWQNAVSIQVKEVERKWKDSMDKLKHLFK